MTMAARGSLPQQRMSDGASVKGVALLTAVTIALCCVQARQSAGGSADEVPTSALAVVERFNQRSFGESARREVILTVRTAGEETDRYRILNLWQVEGDVCTSLFYLVSSSPLQDTSYLVREQRGRFEEFDIWLYLPTSDKVVAVDSRRRGQHLLGSDFTYDDLAQWIAIDGLDLSYGAPREVSVSGVSCHVIEAKAKTSVHRHAFGWARARYFIGHQSLLLMRAEYFRADETEPIRVFQAEEPVLIDEVWTVKRMRITRGNTRFETTLDLVNAGYDQEIDHKILQPQALPHLDQYLGRH